MVLTLSGCSALNAPCQSIASKGVIRTEPLSGELGPIAGGSGVGVDLTNEASPDSGLIAAFSCTELTNRVEWKGSMIAEDTGNVGVLEKEFVWHFVLGTGLGELETESGTRWVPFVNDPVSFEGGPHDYLLAGITEGEGTRTVGLPPHGSVAGIMNGKGEALIIKP